MRRIFIRALRLLGLVGIPAPSWKEFERRFAESERARLMLVHEIEDARGALAGSEFPVLGGDVAASVRALRSGWAAHAAALVEQLSSAQAGGAAASSQANILGGQLQACVREREVLSLSIGRSDARVKALARRRDRLAAERDAALRQLAADDVSGRIRDLEAENRRLTLRVADLERYLAETRGEEARAYL